MKKKTRKRIVKVTDEECAWIAQILEERNPNWRTVRLADLIKTGIIVWQGQRGGIQ